jgi:hypothetical protein
VPNKVAGNKLLAEMWVAGNRFRALPYIPNKADTLCGICSQWGHSEYRCQRQSGAVCGICAGNHRTEGHRCDVATCGAIGRGCQHVVPECSNCGGSHLVRDARCRAKNEAIAIARGTRGRSGQPTVHEPIPRIPYVPAANWSENPEEMEAAIEMETSGTAPPMAV